MPTQSIPINPEVLAWALDERGITAEDFAASLKKPLGTVEAWLTGDEQPSKGEWTKIAKRLKRPRSVFLLPEPPAASVPPNLRTAAGRGAHDLGPKELLQVRRARRLQRYLGSLFTEFGEGAVALPEVAPTRAPEEAGRWLRDWLVVPAEEQLTWESASTALRGWREALEARGLVVLQLQLGKEGMRGFSIEDDVAPLIAVNTAENNEARTFTLMHELAHLASRSQSACAMPPSRTDRSKPLETWCDRVAAAVLLPRDAVQEESRRILQGPRAPRDELGLARRVATRFQTSLRASGLRLMELDLASDELYSVIEQTYPNRDRKKPRGGPGGGQLAPERRLGELGYRASRALLEGFRRRRLTEGDARDLLRLDGPELHDLKSLVETSE